MFYNYLQTSLFRCSVPEQNFDHNKLNFQTYNTQDVVEVDELAVDVLYLTQIDVQLMNLTDSTRVAPSWSCKDSVASAAGAGVSTGPPSANAEFPKLFEGRSGIGE